MKGLTVFLAALLLTVNLSAAPDEGGADELRPEVFDLEFALPEFVIPELELPPLPMMEEYEYEMLAYAGEDKPGRGRRVHRPAERIQLYRLWKIMEDLDLTEDQVDKFFPLMRELGKKEKVLAKERHALVKSMREELNKDDPSESKLKQSLADLKRNARAVVEAKNGAIDNSAEILSIEQQVRMALELNEVERNIWESIARVRHLPPGTGLGAFGVDKKKLQLNMKQLREHLGKISRDLEARGLPGFEADIDAEPVDEDGEHRDKDR